MRHLELNTSMKFGKLKTSKSAFLSTTALIKAVILSSLMGFSAIGTAHAQDSDGDGVLDVLEGYGVLPDGTLISAALGGSGVSTDGASWENVLSLLPAEQVLIESFEGNSVNTALDGFAVPGAFSLSVLSVGTNNAENDIDGFQYGTRPRTGSRQATLQMGSLNQITTFEMNFDEPIAGFGMYLGDIHDGSDLTRLQILFDDVAVWDSTDHVGPNGTGVVTDSITGNTQTLGNQIFGFIGSYDIADLTQKVTIIYENNPDNDTVSGGDNFTIDDISVIYPGTDCDGNGVPDHEQADNEFIGVVKGVDTSALSSPPQAGEEVTYTYTVSNLCATTMYDVTVAETPANFTGTGTLPVPIYVSGGSSIDLDPATGITFDPAIADLDANDDAPIVFEATYALTHEDIVAGGVENNVTATGTDGSGGNQESDVSDPNVPGVAGDNATSFSLAQVPNLSITKVADSTGPHAPGDVVTYTYTATNDGNVNINDVTVSDVHNGFAPLGALTLGALTNTSGLSSDDSADAVFDILAPGDVVNFTAEYVVTATDLIAGGPVTNTATATGTPSSGALTPPTASESISLTGTPRPALAPGVCGSYAREGFLIIPGTGRTEVNADFGSGAPGLTPFDPYVVEPLIGRNSSTGVVSFYQTSADDISTGSFLSNGTALSGSDQLTSALASDPNPESEIWRLAARVEGAPGTTETITIQNTGAHEHTAYWQTDINGVIINSDSSSVAGHDDGWLFGAAATVTGSEGTSYTIDVTYPADGIVILQFALLDSTGGFGGIIFDGYECPAPSLSMTKVADSEGPHTVGDVITYTYTISNDGNQIIRDVAIADTHNGSDPAPTPGNETLLTDAAPTGDSTDAGTDNSWDVLAPGDTVVFTGTYTITATDAANL